MSEIDTNLNTLQESRNDIKTAIENKLEIDVTVPMTGYADLIKLIPPVTFSKERTNKLQFWMTFENSTASDKAVFESFDFSNVKHLGKMFKNCKNLTEGPTISVSRPTKMDQMFQNCTALVSVPAYTTEFCDWFVDMFNGCVNLTTVPTIYLSTDYADNTGPTVTRMFKNCSSLTEISLNCTTTLTGMSETFYGCSNLTTITGDIKCRGNNFSEYRAFYGCSKLANLDGFSGLAADLNLKYCPLLTLESLTKIINSLGTAGYDSHPTLDLHANAGARLTTKLITTATDKGWTISY